MDEFLLAGEVQETSKKQVLKAIAAQDLLQEVHTYLSMYVWVFFYFETKYIGRDAARIFRRPWSWMKEFCDIYLFLTLFVIILYLSYLCKYLLNKFVGFCIVLCLLMIKFNFLISI